MSGLGKLKYANFFPNLGFENRFWTFINVQNTKVDLKMDKKLHFFHFHTIMVSFSKKSEKV